MRYKQAQQTLDRTRVPPIGGSSPNSGPFIQRTLLVSESNKPTGTQVVLRCTGCMRLVVLLVAPAFLFACGGGTLTKQATASSQASAGPTSVQCGSEKSERDAAGKLIGSTRDSTTIRIAAPQEIRVADEVIFQWHMTGVSPLNVTAEQAAGLVGDWGRLPRVDPTAVEAVGDDAWIVRMTFPTAGCWRLHSERAGGKLSGDVWIDVLPRA